MATKAPPKTPRKTRQLVDPAKQLLAVAPYLDVDALASLIIGSPGWDETIAALEPETAKVYPSDPTVFMRDILGYQMWPKLADICNSVIENHNTVVESGFGVGKCRQINDAILLANGTYVKAKDLINKTFAIVGYDHKDWSMRPMLATAEDNGEHPCLRITLRDGTAISCTKNHPLLTWDGWINAENLSVGARIGVPLNTPYFSNYEVSDDKVKLLAYLLTEGCTKYGAVRFSQNPGIVQDEFCEIIFRLGDKCNFTKINDISVHGKIVDGKRDINHSLMLIREWELDGKSSYTKEVPGWVFSLNEQQTALFINRMFAGDGWVCSNTKRGHTSVTLGFCSSSKSMAHDVKRLLLKFGIRGKIRAKTSKRYGSISYSVDINGSINIINFFTKIGFILGKEAQSQLCLDSALELKAQRSDYDIIPESAYPEMRYAVYDSYTRRGHITGKSFKLNDMGKVQKPSRIVLRDVERLTHKTLFNGWSESDIGWCAIVGIEDIGMQPTVAICVPESQAYVTDVIDHNSTTAAALVMWWMCTHDPAVVVTLAPTFAQINNIIWAYIRDVGRRVNLPGTILEAPKWKISDSVWAVGVSPRRSTDLDLASLSGRHNPNLLVIMDEAAGLPRSVWDVVQGLAVGGNNRVCAIANPIEQAGPFWDATNHENWQHIRISCLEHPNVLTGIEQIPGAVTREWVNDRCKDWATECGNDTPEAIYIPWQDKYYKPLPIFMAKVLGIAPEQAEDQLIKLSWVIEAQNRVIDVSNEGGVIGVDCAPRGGDDNVLCHRQGHRVSPIKRSKGQDTQMLAEWLQLELLQTGAVKAYIDDIGPGIGTMDRARKLGLPAVAVNFSSRASQRKRFANLRAECYWTVRELLREGKMQLPSDPMLAADLTAPKYAPDPYGRILIESKDDIRARLGRSPDAGDGLALTYAVPITESSDELEAQQRAMIQESTWNGSRWLVQTPNPRLSRWRK